MNERLDDLRRALAREAHDHNAKEAIKGLRWLLLLRHDNLEKDAARRLARSLALNEPLQYPYLLKEDLAGDFSVDAFHLSTGEPGLVIAKDPLGMAKESLRHNCLSRQM